ncbi:hypothetical protein F2P56_017954 [Juglans regia]|uniref:RRM domain-containing protein n=2 Tax=Juglans regia TaxID=51240 RepID=A0A833UY03_JUGRE|nr:RNA-binding protein 38-like isoform X3 [Juglans regia]KAF5461895.1 hypothetical protein F2P56_017954 [Juglans regia]
MHAEGYQPFFIGFDDLDANMTSPQYRSQFGDTTFTKVFVGGLAWETPTEEMRRYFERFGEILEAVIITDKSTGKSKGYGFVTFRDPESARRACAEPNPVIDGRRANCNIASFGRPRPSPPRGRNQGSSSYQGRAPQPHGALSYSGIPAALPPPPPPPLPVIYPSFGYPTYATDYGYHQIHRRNNELCPQKQKRMKSTFLQKVLQITKAILSHASLMLASRDVFDDLLGNGAAGKDGLRPKHSVYLVYFKYKISLTSFTKCKSKMGEFQYIHDIRPSTTKFEF